VYTLNNIAAKKSADGSVAIQFGDCDGKVLNCLPIEPGWNYTVRLYRPRPNSQRRLDLSAGLSRELISAHRYSRGNTPMTGSHGSASSTKRGTKWFKEVGSTWCLLVAFAFVIFSDRASAQPVDVSPTWGGDILSRPRLTGDWGGLRDELGQKGIVLDVDLLLTPQVVMGGGRNTGGSFRGNLDYTLNVDTQKLGLWPGGFFKVSADTGFGSNAFQDAGTIVPVKTAALLPAPDDRTTALTNATFTQFLSPGSV
jgi:hypothetical protein